MPHYFCPTCTSFIFIYISLFSKFQIFKLPILLLSNVRFLAWHKKTFKYWKSGYLEGLGESFFKSNEQNNMNCRFFCDFWWVLAHRLVGGCGLRKIFLAKLLERSPDGLLNGSSCFGGLRERFLSQTSKTIEIAMFFFFCDFLWILAHESVVGCRLWKKFSAKILERSPSGLLSGSGWFCHGQWSHFPS